MSVKTYLWAQMQTVDSPVDKLVLLAIAEFAGSDGESLIGPVDHFTDARCARIAASLACGVTAADVRDSLQRLDGAGMFVRSAGLLHLAMS